MKLVMVSGALLLLAASVPLLARRPAMVEAAPLSLAVTPGGEVLSASLPSERTLRITTQREGAEAHRDLELTALPEGSRLLDVKLGPFGDKGLAAILAVEFGDVVEYRYLFTAGDPLHAELVMSDPFVEQGRGVRDPWMLSEPLFTSTGARYRLVDVHNPGGDSLEMTFRRGEMQGVRNRGFAGLGVDERIIHDVCPMFGKLAGRGVVASVAQLVPSP
jgi:hypothetical protein